MVAESNAPDVSIRAVARRHGQSASQLVTWRRLARGAPLAPRPAPAREPTHGGA
ncbi:transposase [Methylobacterium nodulans]|uniref:transposase n=1 Tax=Methylobacterium nodulans TaxID=114616 RepID=UPI0012ED07CB